MELDSALKALSVASSVHLFPHLEDPDLVPLEMKKKLDLLEVGGITIMPFKYIIKISKDSPGELVIHLSDGSQHRVGWILYKPNTCLSTPLLCCQLGVELNGKGDIKVGPSYETNVTGVFATGDCVNMSKHVPAAINDGSIAGEAAHFQLTMQGLEYTASNITMELYSQVSGPDLIYYIYGTLSNNIGKSNPYLFGVGPADPICRNVRIQVIMPPLLATFQLCVDGAGKVDSSEVHDNQHMCSYSSHRQLRSPPFIA